MIPGSDQKKRKRSDEGEQEQEEEEENYVSSIENDVLAMLSGGVSSSTTRRDDPQTLLQQKSWPYTGSEELYKELSSNQNPHKEGRQAMSTSDAAMENIMFNPDVVDVDIGEKLIRNGPWEPEEDIRLEAAIARCTNPLKKEGQRGRVDWKMVSAYMGNTRTPKQCYGRYSNTGMNLRTARKLGAWEEAEDKALLAEVERQRSHDPQASISWTTVSEVLGGGRTRKQCMARYNSVLQFQDSKEKVSGNWNVNEDNKLVEAVRLFRGKGRKGGVAWQKVSEYMGRTRTMKQCKKRWDDAFEHPNSLSTTSAARNSGS